MSKRNLILLCKDQSDLADMQPLYHALVARGHRVTFVVDPGGSIAATGQTPPFARVHQNAHDLEDVLAAGVDGVVSSCPEGGIAMLKELDSRLTAPTLFFFLPDARKVRFRDITRRLASGRKVFLANESSTPTIGARLYYTPGLPRFDGMVQLPPEVRARRRRLMRSIDPRVNQEDFVVLFAGQKRETARVFQDVTTVLRGIPPAVCDNPLPRVLCVFPCEHMSPDEQALWGDVLGMKSIGAPGLLILDDICRTKREKIEAEKRRVAAERSRLSVPQNEVRAELLNASLADAVLAADLVVSSTHTVLLTAVALGVKSLSYFAPHVGETAYHQEINGNPDSWSFLPEPRGCIRQVTTYNGLREAINSAIPRRMPDGSLQYPFWPEQQVSASAPWTQGNNTTNCADAIEDAFLKLGPQ